MLCMKDSRQKGVIIDCRDNALAAAIGILKVVSLEREECNEFRNFSTVRLEIWCFVESGSVFTDSKEIKKKKV